MLRGYGRLLQRLSLSSCHIRHASAATFQVEQPVKPGRGRPRKDAGVKEEEATRHEQKKKPIAEQHEKLPAQHVTIKRSKQKRTKTATTSANATAISAPNPVKKTKSRKADLERLPPRLLAKSPKHHDLASFLKYAATAKLKTDTNVYRGTLYEYTVADALKAFNFSLLRSGRSNDLGIDLVGHWKLPHPTRKRGHHELRVLVQCKAAKPSPSMVRELEGAYVGALAGWRGEDVMALLVSSKPCTKGVTAALQRSRWPMGMMQVSTEGALQQFLWNEAAAKAGLDGMGVTVRYTDADENMSQTSSLALTWLGDLWPVLKLKK